VPVAQSQGHAGKALAIAAVGVIVALGLAFLVAQAASRGDVQLNLGDERFEAGEPGNIAARIAKDGGLPVLYPDLVHRDRNIFVQHLGGDDDTGWVAFGAFDPDDPSCAVEIDREAKTLVNACDPSTTYPLTGAGLRSYPTTVEGDRVIVDLNAEARATSTTRG
jgi:hypothetical protein